MKKWIAALLIGCMTLSLFGCGDKKEQNSAGTKAEENTETKSNTGTKEDAAAESNTDVVELIYWKSYNVDAYKGLIEK